MLACLIGGIAIVVIVTLNLVGKMSRTNNDITDEELGIIGFPEPLSRDRFPEDFLDSQILIGMTYEDVNLILGKHYRYAEFMGTMHASYLFESPTKKGLNLSGFTVIYRDNKVIEVTKMWNSM